MSTLLVSILSLLLVGGFAQQAGSSNGVEPAPASNGTAEQPRLSSRDLPVSVKKIQKALAQPPAIQVKTPSLDSESGLPTFRIQVEGQKLTIEEILGPDYLRGPVPYGGMTHQEFLKMVTPTDVQGYAAFSNKQAATVALTSLALQWTLKTALEKFHEARDERAREEARKEVRDALEALRKARRDAGLPDK